MAFLAAEGEGGGEGEGEGEAVFCRLGGAPGSAASLSRLSPARARRLGRICRESCFDSALRRTGIFRLGRFFAAAGLRFLGHRTRGGAPRPLYALVWPALPLALFPS